MKELTLYLKQSNSLSYHRVSHCEILVQHLIKSRSESLCVWPAYVGPVQTFQNIQIFSLCLTGLRLAYQTSCRWKMWLLLYPPLYRCMNRDLPCVEEKGLSAHSLYYNQSGSPSLWMKMFKDQLYWNWGTLKSKTIENNNLLSCWISIGLVAELYNTHL